MATKDVEASAQQRLSLRKRDQRVSGIAINCRILFRMVVQKESPQAPAAIRQRLPLLFRQPSGDKPILTLSDLRDDFEQFRVWANNLGVFATDNSSLDYRLREATEVRDGIVALLKNLESDLSQSLQLLERDRTFDSEESEGSESDSDNSMIDDEAVLTSIRLTASELQSRLRNISEVIDKLMKLAEIIRAQGSKNRTIRAAEYEHYENGVNQTVLFEKEYLPRILKLRYKLEEPLLSRFCKAISLRRRRFLYQAKHQKRLIYGGGAQEEPRTRHEVSTETRSQSRKTTISPSQLTMTAKRGPILGSATQAPTKATTFKIEQKQAPSKIVSASTKSVAAGVDIPPPPKLPSTRATHFQCPYCCIMVPRPKIETQSWRQHVVADLHPFICIEPDCHTPDIIFESKSEWIEHQRWQHAIEWWCAGDDSQHAALKFPTEDAFSNHLVKSHQISSTSASLRSRLAVAAHPSLTPFSCCPLCDFLPEDFASLNFDNSENGVWKAVASQKVLQDHLATELMNIFLIALPERYDIDGSDTDTETERSFGTRSTVLADLEHEAKNTAGAASNVVEWEPGDEAGLTMVEVEPEREADPLMISENWNSVWASPQLQRSVRETYQGAVHDDVLKRIAIAQDQYDQVLFGNWIPGVYLGRRKLLSPRLLPADFQSRHLIHIGYTSKEDFFPVIKVDTDSGNIEFEKYIEIVSEDVVQEVQQIAQLLPEEGQFERGSVPLAELAAALQGERGIKIKNRRWHVRLNYSCFVGEDFTSWLVQNVRDIDTREEAIELGNDLMREGLFEHVNSQGDFKDGKYFYSIKLEYRAPRPEQRKPGRVVKRRMSEIEREAEMQKMQNEWTDDEDDSDGIMESTTRNLRSGRPRDGATIVRSKSITSEYEKWQCHLCGSGPHTIATSCTGIQGGVQCGHMVCNMCPKDDHIKPPWPQKSSDNIPRELSHYRRTGNTLPSTDATQQDDLVDYEDYSIHCICGYDDDDDDARNEILCKSCGTWQHIDCYYSREQVPYLHICADCVPQELDAEGAAQRQLRKHKTVLEPTPRVDRQKAKRWEKARGDTPVPRASALKHPRPRRAAAPTFAVDET